MKTGRVSVPPRLPGPADQIVGRVFAIPAGLSRYQDYPCTLRVTRVRADISRWYGGDWVWIEGIRLDDHQDVIDRVQALVHVDALALPLPPGDA